MKKNKFKEKHAGVRLVERMDGAVSLQELHARVANDDFEFVARLSKSRSLARAQFDPTLCIYFIINRDRRTIITVLSEAQAKERLLADRHPAADEIRICES
jgi:hypothetical protein